MQFAVVTALASATALACGSTDLQPIREVATADASLGGAGDAGRGGSPAVADAGPGGGRCKRGIASNAAPPAVFAPTASSPGISWWYNWSNQSPGGTPPIDFVPMIWGGGSLGESIPAGSQFVLGFNDPNSKSQANLTAQQAAADWPQVEARATASGASIVSPGVGFCVSASDASPSSPECTEPTVTDPYTYLKDFLAGCPGCEVDYIAVHSTDCDVSTLRDYLEGNPAAGFEGFVQFERPIWVTELSCDESHSVLDQKTYMQAAIPYLESNPTVMRYAWFNADPIPNAELTRSDGSLTDLGTTYVGLPQNCP
jgi:hypothetical protein